MTAKAKPRDVPGSAGTARLPPDALTTADLVGDAPMGLASAGVSATSMQVSATVAPMIAWRDTLRKRMEIALFTFVFARVPV